MRLAAAKECCPHCTRGYKAARAYTTIPFPLAPVSFGPNPWRWLKLGMGEQHRSPPGL